MEAAIQQNTYVTERVFAANPVSVQTKSATEENSSGHSIAYFVRVFVVIFSIIMVAVMIEERFFIK